jgi:hypothetical protein
MAWHGLIFLACFPPLRSHFEPGKVNEKKRASIAHLRLVGLEDPDHGK